MAIVTINDEYLTNIANAIRSKNGTENTYKPKEMAAAIAAIDTSSGDSGSSGSGSTTELIYTIPDGVSTISDKTFFDSSLCGVALNKVITTSSSVLTTIGESAFRKQTKLTSFVFPPKLMHIGQWAFSECSNLQSVDLSGTSMTELGVGDIFSSYSFYGCSHLTSVMFPNTLTRIGNGAFALCSALTSITLPSKLTQIGYLAFSQTGLESIVIPESVTTIGDYDLNNGESFSGCPLTTVTFKGTPNAIHETTFYGCSSLTDIYVPWSSGAVAGAPWGATNATIHYNSAT
jgi:hypothetical protein